MTQGNRSAISQSDADPQYQASYLGRNKLTEGAMVP